MKKLKNWICQKHLKIIISQPKLFQSFNHMIDVSISQTGVKSANIALVFKKDKKTQRPVSIIPNASKIYGRYLFSQMSSYFRKVFSKYQRWISQGISAQYCLISITESIIHLPLF